MNSSQLSICKQNGMCPYFNQRALAATSKITTFNYASFLNFPKHLRKREFLILDEATEFEKQIVSSYSLTVDVNNLGTYGIDIKSAPTKENLEPWLNDLVNQVSNCVSEIVDKIKSSKGKPKSKDITAQRFLSNYLNSVSTVIEHLSLTEYLISDDGKGSFIIEPLHVDSFCKEIFENAKTVIFMGATIIDPVKQFTKTLGIEKKEMFFIDVPSTFPPENSPIIFCGNNYLNNKNLDSRLPSVKSIVNELCTKHAKEKGIIHSHNFKITKYLNEHLKGNRFIFRNDNATNMMMLMEHSETNRPTVMISPSMTHGIDLKDDLARFQVIVKAPYLPLTNERVKRLAKEDPDWYKNEMLSTFMQACGRGSRNENDHCVTYVVDLVIANILKEKMDTLPKYFINRLK